MKKLVLMAVSIVAVSFASCGNKAADAAKATQDSIRIADSIAAVEAAALEAEQEISILFRLSYGRIQFLRRIEFPVLN